MGHVQLTAAVLEVARKKLVYILTGSTNESFEDIRMVDEMFMEHLEKAAQRVYFGTQQKPLSGNKYALIHSTDKQDKKSLEAVHQAVSLLCGWTLGLEEDILKARVEEDFVEDTSKKSKDSQWGQELTDERSVEERKRIVVMYHKMPLLTLTLIETVTARVNNISRATFEVSKNI
jgi:hypothetical protein